MENIMEQKMTKISDQISYLEKRMDFYIGRLATMPWHMFVSEFGENATKIEVKIDTLKYVLGKCQATPTQQMYDNCRNSILRRAMESMRISTNPISNALDMWANNAYKELVEFFTELDYEYEVE